MVEIVEVGTDPGRLAAFRALLREYQAELPEELRVPNLEKEIDALPQRYGAGALLLALREEQPVGCVVVNRIDQTSVELKRLYVAPAARRFGAGRALTEAVVALARRRGFGRVVLDTHSGRLPVAYALYRSLGFRECAPYAEAEYACPTFLELVLS